MIAPAAGNAIDWDKARAAIIYHATLRHGGSTVRSGKRHTLGIIFHDAR